MPAKKKTARKRVVQEAKAEALPEVEQREVLIRKKFPNPRWLGAADGDGNLLKISVPAWYKKPLLGKRVLVHQIVGAESNAYEFRP